MWNLANRDNIIDTEFLVFDSLIEIVLTCVFGHNIMMLKMVIFNKVDFIEIEPALVYVLYMVVYYFLVLIYMDICMYTGCRSCGEREAYTGTQQTSRTAESCREVRCRQQSEIRSVFT